MSTHRKGLLASTRLAQRLRRLRGLTNATPDDPEGLEREVARRVHRLMRVIYPIMFFMHALFTAMLMLSKMGHDTPLWRVMSQWLHGTLTSLSAAASVALWASSTERRWHRWISPVTGVTYIAAGAILAGGDQLVGSSINPYVLACFGLACGLLLSRAQTVAVFLGGFALFALLQGHFQHVDRELSSNVLYGLTTSLVASAIAMVLRNGFERDHRRERTILAQAAELSGSLVALQAANEHARHLAARSESGSRAKSEFLANVSHEIRTPLNAVLGFCEILSKDARDPVQRRRIEGIESASRTLLALMEDILDLSRMESGAMVVLPKPGQPGETIREVAALLAPRSSGVSLSVEVDPALSEPAMIDETRLRQIVLNLVGNALKFTNKGEVHLRARRVTATEGGGETLEIEVEDTGIGIPEDDHERIFEPFVQQSGAASRNYGGAGLGLSITRQIVQAMHGTIRVASEPGRGSNFAVALPFVKAPAESLSERAPSERSTPAARDLEAGVGARYSRPPSGAQCDGALAALDGALRARRDDCLRMLRTDHIEALVRELTALGRETRVSAIGRYADGLSLALEAFDVPGISEILRDYDGMVSDVRALAGACAEIPSARGA